MSAAREVVTRSPLSASEPPPPSTVNHRPPSPRIEVDDCAAPDNLVYMPTSGHARLRRIASQHLDFVWRCLRRFGVSVADVDDATQQVFLVAALKLDEVPADKERAFLFATAARIAANARRSSNRRQHAYDNLQTAPQETSANPEQLSDQLRARALLDQVMSKLPDELREVFVLFEIEEFSIQEISEVLDIPMGTVGSRLRRARKLFDDLVLRHKARIEFRGKA